MPASGRAARRVGAALALLLVACAPAADPGLHVDVRPAEVRMPASARVALIDVVELRASTPAFGGFSGLAVARDGARFVALSDVGLWFEGRLVRAGDAITAVEGAGLRSLRRDGGRASSVWRDAEGLAIPDPDLAGPRFASFERVHRLARFDAPEGDEVALPLPFDVDDWDVNSGLEALAHAPDGRLLALREAPWVRGGPIPGWWLTLGDRDVAAARVELTRPDDLAVTSADFGPDGRLYVLGRRFDWLAGFSFAIWRFEVAGDVIGPGEVLLHLPAPDGADNAEGIATWRDPVGRVRLLVITDDNFQLLQRTLLYDFAVLD